MCSSRCLSYWNKRFNTDNPSRRKGPHKILKPTQLEYFTFQLPVDKYGSGMGPEIQTVKVSVKANIKYPNQLNLNTLHFLVDRYGRELGHEIQTVEIDT